MCSRDELCTSRTWAMCVQRFFYIDCLDITPYFYCILGHGRITPAASTVDLQYGEKSKQSQLNTLEDVEVVNEELGEAEIAGKKNLIPRTR